MVSTCSRIRLASPSPRYLVLLARRNERKREDLLAYSASGQVLCTNCIIYGFEQHSIRKWVGYWKLSRTTDGYQAWTSRIDHCMYGLTSETSLTSSSVLESIYTSYSAFSSFGSSCERQSQLVHHPYFQG